MLNADDPHRLRPPVSNTIRSWVVSRSSGVYLGRPVTSRHTAAAVAMLLAGLGAHLLSRGVVGGALLAGAGMALMWPLKPCI
jgi:sugar phosphate permease